MSDPRLDDRNNLRAREGYRVRDNSGWIIASVIAALLVAGLMFYGLSGDAPRTASTPAAETTGRVDRAPTPPANPLPANPNATQPQRDPTTAR